MIMKYFSIMFITMILFAGCGYKTDPKYSEDKTNIKK